MFVYELPCSELKDLCDILDEGEKWEKLAFYMKYDTREIKLMKRTPSAAEELLDNWGIYNHTVLELFVLLSRIEVFNAMNIIKKFVDEKYHTLIYQDAPNELSKDSCQHEWVRNTFDNNNIKYDHSAPSFNFCELQDCTNQWSSSNIIGKGAFGIIYKGTWKYTDIAVRRIISNKSSLKSLIQCLYMANTCRHDNIQPVYGYSCEEDSFCLITPYMTSSLANKLDNKTSPLTWMDRTKIAIGIARGLQYLHTFSTDPFVHGNIKPSNILLDSQNVPKIADLGLRPQEYHSKDRYKVNSVYYLSDEFLRSGIFNVELDTYSFGLILLQLATWLDVYDRNRKAKHIKDFVLDHEHEILMKRPENLFAEIFYKFLEIGKLCIQKKKQRPEMVAVLKLLETLKF